MNSDLFVHGTYTSKGNRRKRNRRTFSIAVDIAEPLEETRNELSSHDSVTKDVKPFPFQKFPPEIRQMILRFAIPEVLPSVPSYLRFAGTITDLFQTSKSTAFDLLPLLRPRLNKAVVLAISEEKYIHERIVHGVSISFRPGSIPGLKFKNQSELDGQIREADRPKEFWLRLIRNKNIIKYYPNDLMGMYRNRIKKWEREEHLKEIERLKQAERAQENKRFDTMFHRNETRMKILLGIKDDNLDHPGFTLFPSELNLEETFPSFHE